MRQSTPPTRSLIADINYSERQINGLDLQSFIGDIGKYLFLPIPHVTYMFSIPNWILSLFKDIQETRLN